MDNSINKNANILTLFKLEAVDYIKGTDDYSAAETMLIGFFDSIDVCSEVENEYRKLPGFCLESCKFIKTPYNFSLDGHLAIDRVYYVQCCKIKESTGEEEVLEVGLFLSEEEAESEKKHLICNDELDLSRETDKTGFNIYIDEYKINQRHWQDGFTRYTWLS